MRLCLLITILQLAQTEGACPKMDLKVAKGMYERGYDKVRVSVVTTPEDEGGCDFGDFFDYNEKFFGPHEVPENKMNSFTLRTAIKEVSPGATCYLNVAGEKVLMKVPKAGGRVRGLLFSDPCIVKKATPVAPPCDLGGPEKFKTLERFTKAINELVGSDEIHFWGILGDNFYDGTGQAMVTFWNLLSLDAKAKPFLTVPGNHDFWNGGYPSWTGPKGTDHYGYGTLQYFGQDVLASSLTNSTPYDFSIPPHQFPSERAPLKGIPEAENWVFFHQLGNVAMFGFSGAHGVTNDFMTSHEALDPYTEQFCTWVGETDTIHSFFVYGHWNGPGSGCQPGMQAPEVYKQAMSHPGCAKKKGLYWQGHDHCNRVLPNAWVGSDDPLPVGFDISASGMASGDCGAQSGFAIVDSIPNAEGGPNVRVDYYSADDEGKWDALVKCWEANPGQQHTKCRDQHSTKWRDVPEPAAHVDAEWGSDADAPECGQPAPPPSPGPPGGNTGNGGDKTGMYIMVAVGAVVVILGLIALGAVLKRRQRIGEAYPEASTRVDGLSMSQSGPTPLVEQS